MIAPKSGDTEMPSGPAHGHEIVGRVQVRVGTGIAAKTGTERRLSSVELIKAVIIHKRLTSDKRLRVRLEPNGGSTGGTESTLLKATLAIPPQREIDDIVGRGVRDPGC